MNQDFLDDLAAMVDGDPAARARHAETLANDDEARDLLHDAEALAERLEGAGADYVPPVDLEARVLAAIGSQTSAFAPQPPRVKESPERPAAPPASLASRKPWLILAGVAATAMLAVSVAHNVMELLPRRAENTAVVAPRHDAAWHGRVAWASPDGAGVRVEAVAAVQQRGSAGVVVPPGARIVTDERTRARIALDDGTTFDLDRDSVLELDVARPRSAKLVRGVALVDVAHVANAFNARIAVSHGEVEVLGTKFVLTSAPTESEVQVLRGTVRVSNARGTVDVDAGGEGLLRGDAAPRALLASGFGALADLGREPGQAEGDAALAGLGELRARRPGEREERERPLRIDETTVDVDLVGSVARTVVTQSFRNEDSVTLEGMYRFPLPDGARIAKLALEVDGRWEEGAFVDKDRGERIFRGVLRQATPVEQRQRQEEYIWVPGPWRDPALLEWQRGGRVELRIFPIPANSVRRVRLTYEESMPTDGETRHYVYPFPSVRRGDARVGRLAMNVRVHGRPADAVRATGYAVSSRADGDTTALSFTQEGFAPAGSLAVDFDEANPGAELRYSAFEGAAVAQVGDRSREREEVRVAQASMVGDTRGYAAFTLRPALDHDLRFVPSDVVLVVDSSQSMVGERFARARRLARTLVSELDPRHRVAVFACDLGCRESGELMPASEQAAEQVEHFLAGIVPGGSTDVARALVTAARRFDAHHERSRVLVYVGDGASTVGAGSAAELEAAASALRMASDVRVTTVGLGDDADARSLAALARAGAGIHVPYRAGRADLAVAHDVLAVTRGALLEGVTVELPSGLETVAPATLGNLAGGMETLVTARVASDVHGDLVLRGKLDGRPFERRYPVQLRRADQQGNAFVPRLWAAARIGDLELRDDAPSQAESVALSRGFGVLSKQTALLVLESEAMFQAFGVDRPGAVLDFDAATFHETVTDSTEAARDEAMDDLASAMPSEERSRAASRADAWAPDTAGAAAPAPRAGSLMGMGGGRMPTTAPAAAMEATLAPPPPAPRPGGRWARRVAYRTASIGTATDVPAFDVGPARARYEENPNSRDRVKALVSAYVRAGDDANAAKQTAAWLERDPGDSDALIAAAEIALRRGDREGAVRTLSGVIEGSPNDRALHERMVSVFEALGDVDSACGHRRALARLFATDAALTAAAAACPVVPRAFGGAVGASAQPASRGSVSIEATFDADVDLVLVSSSGRVYSVLGGRRGMTVRDAGADRSERMSFRSLPVGTYYVQVVPVAGDEDGARGTLRIRAYDANREIPFSVDDAPRTVARIVVTQAFRLEF